MVTNVGFFHDITVTDASFNHELKQAGVYSIIFVITPGPKTGI